jgi:uncharacterized repeat protein (TIGR03803 family)
MNARALVLSIVAAAFPSICAAQTETVIHSFTAAQDSDGAPRAGLLMDASGALYGTTSGGLGDCPGQGCGAVFKLTAPARGGTGWTETILHVFKGKRDSGHPVAGLIMDAGGALYGTTSGSHGGDCADNGCGSVFKLTPPSGGQTRWTTSILHVFPGGQDGAMPEGRLMMDTGGTLYGTTLEGGSNPDCISSGGCGTVFSLTPMGGNKWKETILTALGGSTGTGPQTGVIADASGNLYGTTAFGGPVCDGCGTVFELAKPTEPGGQWVLNVILAFKGKHGASPAGDLIRGGDGALYGTASEAHGDGNVFMLTPPKPGKTKWTETVLYRFDFKTGSNPRAGVIMDANGALYGTASFGGPQNVGMVFKLTPPNGNTWTETTLHTFTGSPDGSQPWGSLIADANGTLYGTTLSGGTDTSCPFADGCGTVFSLTP